ncbi:DUF6924 domain-containing protein [Rufibacter aurantiacus]|uniref:DUF6924 domain-containing protein n=2 Tax=Rufibacter TaxID=1379908 RepID=UPI001B3085E6|nr:hypothetical protein [Rufibacter aurantiacus]
MSSNTQTLISERMLPDTKDVLVLRTDFSDDGKWEKICNWIAEPTPKDGFKAAVYFLSEKKFGGLESEELLTGIAKNYKHFFIFIVDSTTIAHMEHPVLCIDLKDNPGDTLRVIPSEMYSIENNLSISNMNFEEFKSSVDSDGVFRGFR